MTWKLRIPRVLPLILTRHTRHRPVEQGDWAAGHARAGVHEEAPAHSEELRGEPAKVCRPHLSQALPRLPLPRWLWAQQTQRWGTSSSTQWSLFLSSSFFYQIAVSLFRWVLFYWLIIWNENLCRSRKTHKLYFKDDPTRLVTMRIVLSLKMNHRNPETYRKVGYLSQMQ